MIGLLGLLRYNDTRKGNNMNVIHKVTIGVLLSFKEIPASSRLLSVAMQRDDIVVWYTRDMDDTTTRTQQFLAVNTGDPFFDNIEDWRFMGTMISSNGIVWHVFAAKETPNAPKHS
jgi:hypothetical protein